MEQLKFDPKDTVYYVETNRQMRLIKEVSFERAQQFKQFEEIVKTYNSHKKSRFFKMLDICDLRFYIIIEAKNLFDKDNYYKLFFERKFSSPEEFQKEHDKYINKFNSISSKKQPKVFDNLGKINKVTGCYLVATKKTDKSLIKTQNSLTNISARLKTSSRFPKEIYEMCEEYKKYVINIIIQERREVERFTKLSRTEQDNLIRNMIDSLKYPNISYDFSQSDEFNTIPSIDNEKLFNKVKIEDTIKNNIHEINDIKFLNSLMNSAIETENYEMCSRIRDRIKELENSSKISLK